MRNYAIRTGRYRAVSLERFVLRSAVAALSFAASIAAHAQAPNFAVAHHPEHLLVQFKPGTLEAARQLAHGSLSATESKRFRYVAGLTLVKVPQGSLQSACDGYLNNPEVLFAEPDYVAELTGIPDDPEFDQLWGLHNTGQIVKGVTGIIDADIDAPEAWDIWTGDANFKIAILDSGVAYTHPDLAANIWTNPGETGFDQNGFPKETNGFDDDGNGWIDDVHGYDFGEPDSDPKPSLDPNLLDFFKFHGTHAAGTVGAVGGNGLGGTEPGSGIGARTPLPAGTGMLRNERLRRLAFGESQPRKAP